MKTNQISDGSIDVPHPASDRPGRALLASIILNVFLAGIIVGGGWQWWQLELATSPSTQGVQTQADEGGKVPPRGLRFAADRLAPEHRDAFRRGLRQMRRDAAPAIAAARKERSEIARLLAAPHFDHAAIANALARSRQADLAVRERIEAYALEFARTLPTDERGRFIDRLEEMGGLRLTSPSATTGN